ncbi:MAG TPA: NHL repeat-containing protein, partial [Gemmatimonadales bacterium]|nr:NHL repeat-containing protein [Gemmatimonadales bacterium]
DTQVCATGTGLGKCAKPLGLATDFETGLLYVADSGNNRVDVFKNGGTELGTPSSLGGVSAPNWIAVDNVAASPSHHDIYSTTADFKVKKLNPNGTLIDEFGEQGDGTPEGCQLERANDQVAVGPGGDVYLADSYDKDGNGGGQVFVNRIVKFDDTGNCIGAVPLFESALQVIRDLAVDSTGAIYVTVAGAGGVIRQYTGAGTMVRQFENLETKGLAVDAADHLFAKQGGEKPVEPWGIVFTTEYDSAAAGGAILHRFDYAPGAIVAGGIPESTGLAALHTPSGDLFASRPSGGSSGAFYSKLPPPGPVLFPEPCQVSENGNTKATLYAEVNPEGKATTVHAEYITEADYEGNGNSFAGPHPASQTPESEPIGPGFEMREATAEAEVEPETEYRCRVVATNADGSTTGEEGSFTSLKPIEIGLSTPTDVGTEEATLNVQADPLGIETSGYFEYVEEATYRKDIEELGPEHGFDHALKAPDPETEEEIDFGAEKGFKLRSQLVKGLAPATAYRFRLHATNTFFKAKGETGVLGPIAFLRTYGSSTEALPDQRAFELVSPGEKNSAEVVGPMNTRGLFLNVPAEIKAASPNGESLTYTSWTSFGDAEGAPATSQYLSKRTATGWSTENVSPGGFQPEVVTPPYLGYSPDLGFGAFQASRTSLAPGCPQSRENLYLHEADGQTRCLTPEAPNASNEFGYAFSYAGASEDGSRAFFRSHASYAGAPTGGFSLYEAHQGQISVASVLPGGEAAPASQETSFGAPSAEPLHPTDLSILRNAISADGTRAIWTYVPGSGPSQLLDRIGGTETIQLDALHGGSSKTGGNGLFWGASKDGSIVYFTDPERLVKGSKAETGKPDLYRYDLNDESLTDLTKGIEAADVQGVLGASEDGSVVYYVARAALTPEAQQNEAAQHAEAGKYNLYRYGAEAEESTFIAQLSGEDADNWNTQPWLITSRVSPDGEHLAFLSSEAKALAGYDNTLAATEGRFAAGTQCRIPDPSIPELGGGPSCPEAFLYDAQSGKLSCASCNPSGSRPLGPALFPFWSRDLEGPRVLSGDGSRLFFESYDRLADQDESAKRDVYEFELPGSGSCTSESAAYDPASGGCHYLLSSGKSEGDSYLIDASADGRDVFLSTRAQLLGSDSNEQYDAYDAREGGGFPEPPQVPICGSADACKPPATAPPAPGSSPASATLVGAGNPRPKKHRARHHKGHSKKHKAKKKRHEKGRGAR